jgi:deazaflavin-dependent oxidoreductase (nitroreductase family)
MPLDERAAQALVADRIVDITTTGRKTGQSRRVEIGVWAVSDGYVINGRPGRARGWYANLLAHPEFTVHVKKSLQADLPARATPVTETEERRRIITELAVMRPAEIDVEDRVARSPLVRVEFL